MACATSVQQESGSGAYPQVKASYLSVKRIPDKDEVRGSSPRGPTTNRLGRLRNCL